MKNFSITKSGIVIIGVCISFAQALTACATHSVNPRITSTNFVIEKENSNIGEVVTVRSSESGELLRISGRVRKYFGVAPTMSYVTVRLLDSNDSLLAEKRDRIASSHRLATSVGNESHQYNVNFPISIARQAKKIRVLYQTRWE